MLLEARAEPISKFQSPAVSCEAVFDTHGFVQLPRRGNCLFSLEVRVELMESQTDLRWKRPLGSSAPRQAG